MFPELRKVVTYDEVIHREGERAANPPLRMIGVAAVVKNPGTGVATSKICRPRSIASPHFWARC